MDVHKKYKKRKRLYAANTHNRGSYDYPASFWAWQLKFALCVLVFLLIFNFFQL